MKQRLIETAKGNPKTTVIGLLAVVAALNQAELVNAVTLISPLAAKYITAAAGVAAGLMLIFGAKDDKNAG